MTAAGPEWVPDMRCTGWIDGWPTWLGGTGHEWLPCCQAHDLAPMTVTSAIDLGECVAKVSPAMGFVMVAGVLVFGPLYLAFRRASRR